MANDTAWADRSTLLSLNQNLGQCLANYKIFFKELEKFKQEVMDNQERKDEFKKLINEMEGWSVSKINNKYSEHKTIYEYLMEK
jgi:hypothetical protein